MRAHTVFGHTKHVHPAVARPNACARWPCYEDNAIHDRTSSWMTGPMTLSNMTTRARTAARG
eukprot:8250023-Lingulodinium_polyedra.AAC.1